MLEYWADQGVSTALGFAVGIATPTATRHISRLHQRVRSRVDPNPANFDPETINFFTLNRWSPDRRLRHSDVRAAFDDSPWEQRWLDEARLNAIRSRVEDCGGPSASLRSIRIDHRESQDGQQLHLTFAASTYGDLIAARDYLARRPDEVKSIMSRLAAEDRDQMVRSAPRSVVAINVTLTAADGKMLAVRRSGAVRTSQNVWTLGPNETMLGAGPGPAGIEAPHDLAQRCLVEEAGLHPDEIDALEISWLGYNVAGAMIHIIAHSRSQLPSTVITSRILESHGAFEADSIQWIPTGKRSVLNIAQQNPPRRSGAPHIAGPWLDSARLAAADWWRWRSVVGA